MLFAGEPSRYGDRLARVPKRVGRRRSRRCGAGRSARGRAPPAEGGAPDAALERVVDVHAFAPGELHERRASAGLSDVRVRGEELLANWFGWTNRTLEATRRPRRRAVGAGASTPTAATCCCRASTAACSSRACRRRSSTT